MNNKIVTLKQASNYLDTIQDTYTNYITSEASKFVEDALNYLYNYNKLEEDEKKTIIINIDKLLESVFDDIDNDIRPIQSIESDYKNYIENNNEIAINDYIDLSEYSDEEVPYISYYTSLKIESERIINSFNS